MSKETKSKSSTSTSAKKTSEKKTSEKASDKTSCACAAAGEPKGSACNANSSTGIQNGKGDAPRNISPRFRSNYDGIRWEGGRKRSSKRQEGSKYVKVYG